MDRDELKFLLESRGVPERQPGCPADELAASYIEGGLRETAHRAFEAHLAACAWCIERIGILGRAMQHEAETSVPDLALERARRMAGETESPAWTWRLAPAWAPALAAAALVVLAIGLMMRDQASTGGPDASSPPTAEVPTTRSIDPGAMSPGSLSPRDHIRVTGSGAAFDWTPVKDSLYYQVRIVSDEGDLLWLERVHGTQWALPGELALTGGGEYFVRVDAFLSETRSVNSDYVLFRAGGQP